MNNLDLYNTTQEYLIKEISTFSQSETQKLGKIIQEHIVLYHELSEPIISDGEYDILLKKLQDLEEKYNITEKVWQTTGSEGKRSSFKKVTHSRPMISLDNTYNAQELRDFDTRIKRILKTEWTLPYTIEFKFDGLGIELIYKEWILLQAITRWNGVQWEDVTENIMQIKNIPKTIDKTGVFEVRGEVVMPISSFERLNKEALELWEKVFSNPRNAASGSLRVLDTSITKKRDLEYFAYDVSDFEEFSSWAYHTMIETLETLGFVISSYFPKCQGIEEVISMIENIWDIKSQLDFEIDGLVVKLDDMRMWNQVGFTEHHPRYSIAYKFPAEIVTTKLESVEHSVGRTWTITPVANLEAVNIAWAMIRRATLHNYDEVEKLGVRVWDIVFLKRAWEVIPKIISVATSAPSQFSPTGRDETAIIPPIVCPSCGENVYKDEEKVRYYCANSYWCPAQIKEKIAFAVGKQGFNIDGFWEKQAELFYNLGYIKTFGDIFRLKNHESEILELEGFKEKSVANLLGGIEKVRNTDIVTFLKALWIPGVGKKTAKVLGKYLSSDLSPTLPSKGRGQAAWNPNLQLYLSWQERIKRGVMLNELQELPDIGPEVAESVVEFFTTQQEMVRDLLSELSINFPEISISKTWGKWQWKKMCITGSFDWYKRDQLAEILEQQWGEFMSSVSAKTDYLLAWEKAWSKLKKAQELWVEVLSLEEFLR